MSLIVIIIIVLIVAVGIYYLFSSHIEYYSANTEEMTTLNQLKTILTDINPQFKKLNIYVGKESLTINKESIYICLKNPKDGIIYPLNLLLYIALHEIAHTMSKSYSLNEHNEEFQANFNSLLELAHKKGYSLQGLKIPQNYCKV